MKNRKIKFKSTLRNTIVLIGSALLLSGCTSSAFIKSNEFLIADGKVDRAIQNYREALLTDPENDEWLYHLANALYKTKKYDQAHTEISKAILLEPQINLYRRLAGKIAYAQTDFFNATNQLVNALLLDNTDLEAYYYLALTYRITGDPDKALAQLETAVSIEPGYFNAQLLLLDIEFSKIKDPQEKSLEEKKPTNVQQETTAASVTASDGQDPATETKNLISRLVSVLRLNPSSVEGTLLLSRMYAFLGESRRAQNTLSDWIDKYGARNREIVLELVSLRYRNGRFTEALNLLRESGLASTRSKILELKILQKTHPQLSNEEEVLTLLKNNKDSTELLLLIARIRLDQGNLLESETFLQKCIDQNPQFAGCYYELSAVLAAQKDTFGSQWALAKAFELSPNDRQIRLDYIERLIDRQEFAAAGEALAHISLDETDPTIAFLKGKIAKEQSDYEMAESLFHYASRYVYAVDIETEFADLEIRQGKVRRAEARLKKIDAIAPGHLKIALVKASLYKATNRVKEIPAILTGHLQTAHGAGRVHLQLADSYARLGNIQKALTILNQGIKTWPRHLELTQAYTFYLGLVNSYERAITLLQDIQAFNHKYNQLFHHRLAFYYYKAGKMTEFKNH